MTRERGKYDGVLNILQYNAHAYVASGCILLGISGLWWLQVLPRAGNALLIAAAVLTAFWTLSSLVASYYVYDYAAVMRWDWLPDRLAFVPQKWVNIHAGLDESSEALQQMFPDSEWAMLDIYDPREMTEPSIARARQAQSGVQTAIACKLDSLPLADKNRDTVFLLFAAHEIRQSGRRVEFLRECARVLSDAGQVALVEHLRDWKNFVAFGPGFLHFHSRQEWLRAAEAAGLSVISEGSVTPLVRCFVLKRELFVA